MDNRVLRPQNEPNGVGVGAGVLFMFHLQTLLRLVQDFLYYYGLLRPYTYVLKILIFRLMSFINTKVDNKTKNRITNTLNLFTFLLNKNESEWFS